MYHVRVDLWVGWWNIVHFPNEYSSIERAAAWISIPTPFLGYSILLFFLISGFCIHFPHTNSINEPSWGKYFKRRFWRIYPTYLIAITLTSLISYICHFLWDDRTWDPERMFRVATISQNYPPGNGQFLINPSLWTIPLEIEFYALYPLAFYFFAVLRLKLLLLIAVALSAMCVYLNNLGMQWLSFTALFLWPSWLLGAWAADLHRNEKIRFINYYWLITVLLVFLCLALASRLNNWQSWTQYATWTGFYFFLFVLVLHNGEFLVRALKSFPLRIISWIGKISFSLYLIHFPFFKLFGYCHKEIFGQKPANFLISLSYLVPVIFFAWIFFVLVENPIHKWSKKRYANND